MVGWSALCGAISSTTPGWRSRLMVPIAAANRTVLRMFDHQ